LELLKGKSSELLKSLADGYEEYSKKLGELKAEAGRLEEEVRFARIVKLLIERPSDCRGLPLDFVLILLGAALNLLNVKGVNPKTDKYSSAGAVDYIEWAIKAIESEMRKGVEA